MESEKVKDLFNQVLSESGLLENVNQIKNTCTETNAKFEKIMEEVDALKSENNEIRKELAYVKKLNVELQSKLSEADQSNRKNPAAASTAEDPLLVLMN